MAHNIEYVNGKLTYAQSYRAPMPWWYNKTTMVPNIVEEADINDISVWASASGLDFELEKVHLFHEVPEHLQETYGEFLPTESSIIRRKDTLDTFGIFKDRYQLVQPSEALEFISQIVSVSDEFEIETACALKKGAIIWVLARYLPGGNVIGEEHQSYIMIATSCDGSLATTASATMVRVVCNNTLNASLYASNSCIVKLKHSAQFNSERQAKFLNSLNQAAEGFAQYKSLAESLSRVKASKDKVNDLFSRLMIGDDYKDMDKIPTRSQNNLDKLWECWGTTLDETEQTYWAVLNAITRYADHEVSLNKTSNSNSAEKRILSSQFESGSGFKLKRDGLDLINQDFDNMGQKILLAA